MQESVPPGEGTMAAILNVENELVEKLCEEVSIPLNDAQWNSFVGKDVNRRESCAEISQLNNE